MNLLRVSSKDSVQKFHAPYRNDVLQHATHQQQIHIPAGASGQKLLSTPKPRTTTTASGDPMKQVLTAMTCVLLTSCSGLNVGHVVAERPTILDHAGVERVDPNGNGSQVARFLDAHASKRTAGLCQGMQPIELTPSDWCLITEAGHAYLVVDYTKDPLGVDGYRIQPVEYRGKNRFYDEESRQTFLLEPWPLARRAQ